MARSTAAEAAGTMTLQEWADLDDEIEGELVDGILEEEEMPSFLHEIIVAWFIENLRRWVRRRGGQVASSETKIAIAPKRGRKPDLSVYLRNGLPALEDALIRKAPHIVVEVTSPRPRDARRDRVDKPHDYARAGIRYYWILDPRLRSLEVFELTPGGRYSLALTASEGKVRAPGCPGLVLDLDGLWKEIDTTAQPVRPRRRR